MVRTIPRKQIGRRSRLLLPCGNTVHTRIPLLLASCTLLLTDHESRINCGSAHCTLRFTRMLRSCELVVTEDRDNSLRSSSCRRCVMDGLEATAAIRAGETDSGKHQMVIALTAHAMKGEKATRNDAWRRVGPATFPSQSGRKNWTWCWKISRSGGAPSRM